MDNDGTNWMDDEIIADLPLAEPPAPANQNTAPRSVIVPSVQTVTRPAYMRRMAIALANTKMSRRAVPDWLATVIYNYQGDIYCGDTGRRIAMEEIEVDAVFGEDGSFRWLSDFLHFANEEPRQAGQSRTAKRLRLMALAFLIDAPDIAEHFAR
jgi:hypothetical protein